MENSNLIKDNFFKELNEVIYNNIAEIVILTDQNGIIKYVNKSFEKITGRKEVEVINKNASILKSGRHSLLFYNKMWECIQKNGEWCGEITNRDINGLYYSVWNSIKEIKNKENKVIGYVSIQTNMSSIKNNHNYIETSTSKDNLTGLNNRSYFINKLKEKLNNEKEFYLMIVNIDNFKEINKTYGHERGDDILKYVSNKIESIIRKTDILARVGGDEFIILLSNISAIQNKKIAERIKLELSLPMLNLEKFEITVSMGITEYPKDGISILELLKNVDTAMYEAKLNGRNKIIYYTKQMSEKIMLEFNLCKDIKNGLKNNEFKVYYQPLFEINDINKIIGTEALLRWEKKDKILYPKDFLEIASKNGLINKIDEYVLEKVIEDINNWENKKIIQNGFKICVNQMAYSILKKDLLKKIKKTLNVESINKKVLEFELNEKSLLNINKGSLNQIKKIDKFGISISIDDFGTGYSNLEYLSNFPISFIKIDQSFIKNIDKKNKNKLIVDAIITISKKFKIKVIAEGIEKLSELNILKKMNCDVGQGFLKEKAIKKEDFEIKYLKERN